MDGTAPGVVRRLRILHVVPTYYPAVRYGGPIRSVHALASTQAAQGHEVVVYTTNVDGPENMDFPPGEAVMRDGVAVHYFPVPALRRLYWSPMLGSRLERDIASFDVAHLHSVWLWPIAQAARAAERAGVPYVMAPRGMLIGGMIRARSRLVKSAWLHLIERRSLARAAALHVTAPLEADEVRALGLPLPPVHCIANGVDFPDAPLPLSATPYAGLRRPYALFLSRLSWKKGLDRLVDAWARLDDLDLVIAGNDEDGCVPELQARAARLGIAQRVHFIGLVSDQDKWSVYAEAQCFLLPSLSENFGNVVAEAMAMACPVILTPGVGIAALVQEAACGLVVDGDPASIAAAVGRLQQDEAFRRQLGERGRRAAREQLAWSAIATRMDRLYAGLPRAPARAR